MASEYGDKVYWDSRYQESEEPFEWFQTFETCWDILEDQFKSKDASDLILHVGCGNSEFGEVVV